MTYTFDNHDDFQEIGEAIFLLRQEQKDFLSDLFRSFNINEQRRCETCDALRVVPNSSRQKMIDAIVNQLGSNIECVRYVISPETWVAIKKDMIQLSKALPTILLKLDCDSHHPEGDGLDRWHTYFSNGKTCDNFVELTYPKFDSKKLK